MAGDNTLRIPVGLTRSDTMPLTPPPLTVESVREDSRRVLEKFLQREISKGRHQTIGEGDEGTQNDRTTEVNVVSPRKTVDFDLDRQSKESESQYTSIRKFDFARTEKQKSNISFGQPIERQTSVEMKSSQSTCSSYDGVRRVKETEVDFQQQTTSAAAAGSSSASSSDVEAFRKRQSTMDKKKKSLLRRAKERLERTLSLRRRRAEEKAEKSKKNSKNFYKTHLPVNGSDNHLPAQLQRSNSEEGSTSTTKERYFNLRFAQMSVSSCPRGVDTSTKKKNGKRTKTRISKEATAKKITADSGSTIFLTPPDSGFRASASKRTKREKINDEALVDQKRIKRTASSIFGEAFASGVKLFKKHSSGSSSGCSAKWLKRRTGDRWAVDSRQKSEKRFSCSKIIRKDEGNGLELLASSNLVRIQNSTGIFHRVSSEFDDRWRQLIDPNNETTTTTTNVVNIQIEPPTSSSTDPQSSLSPPWSAGGGESQPDSDLPKGSQSAESSQDRRSSDDSMEEKYALIARRLADLGDAFLSRQWTQMRAPTPDGERPNYFATDGLADEAAASALPSATVSRLSSIEQEVVEFINACDRDMRGSNIDLQRDIVLQLVRSDTSHQFGRVLNTATDRSMATSAMGWTRLAVIFYLTTAAVRVVGASTDAARRLVDYCCDYVTFTFSGWIIGQGGWSSVVEDQSSGEDEKTRSQDR